MLTIFSSNKRGHVRNGCVYYMRRSLESQRGFVLIWMNEFPSFWPAELVHISAIWDFILINVCLCTYKWFTSRSQNGVLWEPTAPLRPHNLHHILTPRRQQLRWLAAWLICDIARFCWNSRHSLVCVLANIKQAGVRGGEWQAWRKSLRFKQRGKVSLRGSLAADRTAQLCSGFRVWSDSSNTLCSCSALLLFQCWQVTRRWMYWLLYTGWQLQTL